MNQTLLIELLTEELPPKALAKLGAAFTAGIVNGLKARDFLEADSVATSYASPRRLAAHISAVLAQAPEQTTGQMGASCATVPARWPATCPTSLRL